MGRWLVILALLTAPAAAQTLEQYDNRQALEQSRQNVQSQAAGRDSSTSATINSRIERLNTRQQIQSSRALPGLGARPPLR